MDYLRQLADALEQGKVRFDRDEMVIEGTVRTKGLLKSKTGRTTLKLKLKFAEVVEPHLDTLPEPVDAAEATERSETVLAEPIPVASPELYKKLKKRMERSFRTLKTLARRGEIPSVEASASFHSDCLAMTGYTGKGDEAYEDFKSTADEFMTAAREGNLAALSKSLDSLGSMRRACHVLRK